MYTYIMEIGRSAKDLFYGEFEKGTNKSYYTVLCFNDVCKRDMKSSAINIESSNLCAKIDSHGGIS